MKIRDFEKLHNLPYRAANKYFDEAVKKGKTFVIMFSQKIKIIKDEDKFIDFINNGGDKCEKKGVYTREIGYGGLLISKEESNYIEQLKALVKKKQDR